MTSTLSFDRKLPSLTILIFLLGDSQIFVSILHTFYLFWSNVCISIQISKNRKEVNKPLNVSRKFIKRIHKCQFKKNLYTKYNKKDFRFSFVLSEANLKDDNIS